jgi:hypothetical protein
LRQLQDGTRNHEKIILCHITKISVERPPMEEAGYLLITAEQ